MAAGSRRAVRGVACASIGLAAALLVGVLFSGQAGPRGALDPADVARVTHAAPQAPAPEERPTRIRLGPKGRDVRLSGELTEGAAERLARLLDTHRGIERIHLTSEGGLVDEGAAIGALIAAHGLVTYVPDYCVSACTLAFVRGRERLVRADARLGFHAPYETDPVGVEIAVDSAPERAAYLAAGVRAEFVDAALEVRPDDLMIPGTDILVEAGVATGIVDADRFPIPVWTTAPTRTGPEPWCCTTCRCSTRWRRAHPGRSRQSLRGILTATTGAARKGRRWTASAAWPPMPWREASARPIRRRWSNSAG
ncbi:hypothetical protein GCM10025880_04720 [Methylorubrum aminovorans]|nr:hypothetical protein [Methylorubrum aminovorans]GMA74055.1 hypothetical protein GCM10025880_04720 [Methylorubrum aminovorans]